jgi:hypothetical protein
MPLSIPCVTELAVPQQLENQVVKQKEHTTEIHKPRDPCRRRFEHFGADEGSVARTPSICLQPRPTDKEHSVEYQGHVQATPRSTYSISILQAAQDNFGLTFQYNTYKDVA